MKKRLNILITNDDGIHAAGIKSLWRALKDIAEITVVAPAVEQSGTGAGITFRSPLKIDKNMWDSHTTVWSVNGTPADCVKLGLNVILKSKPDLIVSGINRGSNAGRNVFYSGTVGGAIEGALQGIPSIAFSCIDYLNTDYELAEKYVPAIVTGTMERLLPQGTLLNVNFPEKNGAQIKGIKLTRQGKEFWSDNPIEREHPGEGHMYYWHGVKQAIFQEEEDCDITWLQRGYIAAVPIHVDQLADHGYLSANQTHFESLWQ